MPRGPPRQNHAWKLPARLALCFIVILSAIFNAILATASARGGGLPLAVKYTLGLAPPVFAILLIVLIVVFWWRSTLEALKISPVFAAAKEAGGFVGEGGGGGATPLHTLPQLVVVNPLLGTQQQLWSRFKDEDGVEYWRYDNPSCAPCLCWELPKGASTLCGWVWVAEEEGWVHASSGAFTLQPPPLCCREARALIEAAHRHKKGGGELLEYGPVDSLTGEGGAMRQRGAIPCTDPKGRFRRQGEEGGGGRGW